MKKILLAALLISPAFAQEEIATPPGMQELMAEMVQGKYRMKEASASPWEEEIIVTSAHIDAYVKNQICENKVADVKFVNNGTNQIAEWRDPNSYEDVMYVGFFKIEETETDRTMMSIQTKTSGKILHKTTLVFRGEPTNNFWIGTGMTIKGMSGGPVIASDGKIVGIIVGAVSPKVTRFQEYFEKFGLLTFVVPHSKINEVRQKCGCKMRSIKIFLFTISAAALTTLVYDVIDVGLLGLLFIIYFLIFAGVIVYWFTLFIGFLLDKFVPKDIQDKIGHALIVWANRQEEISYTTPKKRKSPRQSQSRYKAQYRQSTTWWDVCPPTFENAAISYAEKYKGNNPNAKVRVVEVIDGKVIGTIYSC